jgi:hypothetical protein
LLREALHTRVGDVNLDGVFDDTDLAILANTRPCRSKCLWTEGDFNGDGVFDEADLLLAFQEGDFDDL